MEHRNAPYIGGNVYARSADDTSEALIEVDVDDDGTIIIVPMDDCVIEVVWSAEHKRLVGVVRVIPGR